MKENDIDWKIFHMVPEGVSVSISKLVESSGLERAIVEQSLERLEKYCLISVVGEIVSAISLNDMFMLNQLQNDDFLEIKDGVIRLRK